MFVLCSVKRLRSPPVLVFTYIVIFTESRNPGHVLVHDSAVAPRTIPIREDVVKSPARGEDKTRSSKGSQFETPACI